MNEDCEYLTQRDEIWHGEERHDLFCQYHLEWCPDCRGCNFNEQENDDDE